MNEIIDLKDSDLLMILTLKNAEYVFIDDNLKMFVEKKENVITYNFTQIKKIL